MVKVLLKQRPKPSYPALSPEWRWGLALYARPWQLPGSFRYLPSHIKMAEAPNIARPCPSEERGAPAWVGPIFITRRAGIGALRSGSAGRAAVASCPEVAIGGLPDGHLED